VNTSDLNGHQPPEMEPEHTAEAETPDPSADLRPRVSERNSGRRNPVVLVVVAVGIALMLAFGIQKARHSPVPAASAGKLQGQPAPDFTLQTLDGKTVKLSDFRGKAVLLNFWATWCEPCKVEMPWFVDFEKKYGSQGLQVLGVAMDDASPAEVSAFAQKMGVNYPVLMGKEEVGAQYGGIDYLPSTFYISRDGKILDHVFGLVSRSEIESNIHKALSEQVAAK